MGYAMIALDQKTILVNKLAELLGFHDGAEDVLEHLLGIESKEDLFDYLTQLLGNDKNELLKAFVLDVSRAKNGELITIDDKLSEDVSRPSVTSTTVREKEYPPKAVTNKNGKDKKVNKMKNQNSGLMGARKVQSVSNVSKAKVKQQQQQPPSKPEKVQKVSTVDSQGSTSVNESPPETSTTTTTSVELTKSRGKAKVCCGCFGTLHKALSNCLHCGRISCEKEGLDFCPFCGYLVEEIKPIYGVDDAAWQLKERLLQYDRESTVRTTVSDDQAEFYNPSVWLTQEERTQATRQEQERTAQLYARQNMQLNLQL